MPTKARREPLHLLCGYARRARLVLSAMVTACLATMATAEVKSARFPDPTDRYAHGVLGDAIEWGALSVTTTDNRQLKLTLPLDRVFEDLEPRLITTPDGKVLVMVVETQKDTGARLSLYDEDGLYAATPHIGRTNRWLAPIGAADIDGDGTLEIAYVDRPHLAKTIRIWKLQGDALIHAADLPGYTNHRIGEDTIAGGIRNCDGTPELIVADAGWQNIMAVTWTNGKFNARPLGPHKNRRSFAQAMAC